MFHTADAKDIIEGKITDVYFDRTMKVLRAEGINKTVRVEFIAKSLPEKWPWGVLAGLEEALHLLQQLPLRVRAMQEGSLFYPYEPVMELEGKYQDMCVYETALLGLLCQASGIATKAARFKSLAGDRPVISFGARRMHPVLAPMIERNAFIGGCDGVSVIKSGEIIGEDPMGTMPHALVICFGSTVEALRAYDRTLDPKVKRVALIDTFLDEKFECLNVAEALGERLHAVRFDTPSSRRGNFYRILEEARWELDMRGYGHVKFYVSGGIKEEDVTVLNPLVDGYGIGTSISNAPVIDFAMDIMEVDGKPLAKRGKWSGAKRVLACPQCGTRKIIPSSVAPPPCPCGGIFNDVLIPVMDHGKQLIGSRSPAELRKSILAAIEGLPLA
ncbi:MAG: nicotinate phosphoribosyltransferase [Alphaproteobacteria bacterium]|uniref:Nicotinate phosphoribosyltransferase n=1 Tax=Candidatus Nitrobium versatile TaxID=2884831 RepID=A0A953J8U9_9BACT|nr:nicotinate phosphoribosyltransferase [Candidatus Nitrobium versatile]